MYSASGATGVTWTEANSACQSLNQSKEEGGYTGWKLPTQSELQADIASLGIQPTEWLWTGESLVAEKHQQVDIAGGTHTNSDSKTQNFAGTATFAFHCIRP